MPTEALPRRSVITATGVALALLTVLGPGSRPAAAGTGPDVTIIYLGSTSNWGATGGVRAYSVGTTSCNIGTTPIAWCDSASCLGGTLQRNDHPVIAQNIYRLKDNRFEQIGMSWLKHGWLSTNSSDGACGSCQSPPGGGDQLGVGCTDTYGSGLNGGDGNPGTCDSAGCRLGQRSAVNATTGDFPMPYHNVAHPQGIDQRMQVAESDVDGTLNPGALYWVEGQYIAGDDGFAGNAYNNASYRKVTVGAAPTYNLTLSGTSSSTVREKSALYAWKAQDATVEILNQDFCTSPVERFEVGRKTTPGISSTHYEYAVRNMNSDHAAGAFTVHFPPGTAITNAYFHDVDSHSGEPYATTDWSVTIDTEASSIRWATEDFGANNNANALRFATMYTFAFDAEAPVEDATHEVELFKPIEEVTAQAGDDAAICPGDSVQLGAPPVAGLTYLWSPGGQTTSQITVSPESTTSYTLTVSSSCAQDQDTVEIAVGSEPAAPALLSPADGATALASPVALDWDAVPGAGTYTFEVASDAGFSDIVAANETGSPGYVLGVLGVGQYFWRVRAYDACPSAYSETFDFSVDGHIFINGFQSGDYSAGWITNLP